MDTDIPLIVLITVAVFYGAAGVWSAFGFREDARALEEQREKRREAQQLRQRREEKLETWCPQLAKAARRRGAKVKPCEHLNTSTLVTVAGMLADIREPGLRERRLQEFIDRNRLPGAKKIHRSSGSSGSSTTKRWEDHLWYGNHHDLDWHDRELGQSWGMDSDTYVSNYLENDKD